MRYHWGLGIGHLHAHQLASTSNYAPDETTNIHDDRYQGFESGESSNTHAPSPCIENGSDTESDSSELGLDDREAGVWEDSEGECPEYGGNTDGDSEGTEEDFPGM